MDQQVEVHGELFRQMLREKRERVAAGGPLWSEEVVFAGKSPEEIEALRKDAEWVSEMLKKGEPLYRIYGVEEWFIEYVYGNGYRFYQSGLYGEARSCFSSLVYLDSGNPRFVLALGASLQMLGDYKVASEVYERLADKLMPGVPLPFFYLYECYVQLGDVEAAHRALERLIEAAAASPEYSEQLERGKLLLQGLEAGKREVSSEERSA